MNTLTEYLVLALFAAVLVATVGGKLSTSPLTMKDVTTWTQQAANSSTHATAASALPCRPALNSSKGRGAASSCYQPHSR